VRRDLSEYDERGRGLDRVIAFSDGVFAIAITLLVLSFRVPHVVGSHNQNHQVLEGLRNQSGTVLSFMLTFYVIARYWRAHHRLSLLLKQVDNRFISLNLIFLALIVVFPFPSEVLGLYGNTITAIVLYASTMVLIGALSTALWRYAFVAGLLDPGPKDLHREVWSRSALTAVVFGFSIPLAFVTTDGAKIVWLLLLASPLITLIVERDRRLLHRVRSKVRPR
jgi:uncharacterized membrane protein